MKLKAPATSKTAQDCHQSFQQERMILRNVSNIINNNHQNQQQPPHQQQYVHQPVNKPYQTAFQPKKLFSSVDIRSVKLKAKDSRNPQNSMHDIDHSRIIYSGNTQPKSIQSALKEAMRLRYAKMHATPESTAKSWNSSPSWD